LISYHHDTATGASMALVTVIVFLVALLARQLARGMSRRSLRLTSSHG
jgi:ABC-type Mn2+/Zn2+ transport system permease subunit